MNKTSLVKTAWYGAAITLGAFLLFALQPMMGRVILPWYGGSTSVWSACLLFFQLFLFAGYLYAHLLQSRFVPAWQARIHGGLLFVTIFLLPLSAGEGWKRAGTGEPAVMIMLFLGATVGLPYLMLAASSPLLQAWAARGATRKPYRLYAFSNAGSLAGLLSYPFLVEPLIDLQGQLGGWSLLYAVYAVFGMVLAGAMSRFAFAKGGGGGLKEQSGAVLPEGGRAMILLLALCGSLLMAATTHAMCEDITVVPLLWVLPLSIYIISFIVVFAWEGFYRRPVFLPLLALATVGVVAALYIGLGLSPLSRIITLSVFLGCACFTCHGEIVRLKPGPEGLTFFYLLLAAGGAAGTSLVIFAAPVLFSGYWELHGGIVLCWALVMASLYGEMRKGEGPLPPWRWGVALVVLVALVAVLRIHVLVEMGGVLRAVRNFYGVLKVVEAGLEETGNRRLELINGGVLHGMQFLAEDKQDYATAYYGRRSGLGLAIEGQRAMVSDNGGGSGLQIGVVGLGVGVVAAHAGQDDRVTFYEINPAVETIARRDFSFLRRSQGAVRVFLGDARLVMEREGRERSGLYDLLVVDAFTGDAIPVHLLTRECVDIYFSRLAPGGRLALNISNRYLDLRPLVKGLAAAAGAELLVIDTLGVKEEGTRGASWAIMARGTGRFSTAEFAAAGASRPLPAKSVLWTDDYSNLFSLLMGRGPTPRLDTAPGKAEH